MNEVKWLNYLLYAAPALLMGAAYLFYRLWKNEKVRTRKLEQDKELLEYKHTVGKMTDEELASDLDSDI